MYALWEDMMIFLSPFFDDLKKNKKQSIFINFNKSKTKKEKYI